MLCPDGTVVACGENGKGHKDHFENELRLAITEEVLKATNKKTLHLNLGMLSDVMKNYLQRLESSTPSS